jgi:hypothetical protein
MTGGLIGFLATALFKGLYGWRDILEAISISILSALGAFVVTFLVSIVKAPKLLDDERRAEIQKLQDENQQLSSKPPIAAKPRYYDEARAALEELGNTSAIILRFLEKHGKVAVRPPTGGTIFQPYMVPPPPAGTTPREAYESLQRCVAKFLVTPSESIIQTGGLYPITEVTYQIATGMKDALALLLDARDAEPAP